MGAIGKPEVLSRGPAEYSVVAFLVAADTAEEADDQVYEDIMGTPHEFLTTEPAEAGFWSVTVRQFRDTDGDPS